MIPAPFDSPPLIRPAVGPARKEGGSMDSTSVVNVFNTYKQENSFTNGLFSLLHLSVYEKPRFIASFLKKLLHLGKKRV
jgi:hypothetical protein